MLCAGAAREMTGSVLPSPVNPAIANAVTVEVVATAVAMRKRNLRIIESFLRGLVEMIRATIISISNSPACTAGFASMSGESGLFISYSLQLVLVRPHQKISRDTYSFKRNLEPLFSAR